MSGRVLFLSPDRQEIYNAPKLLRLLLSFGGKKEMSFKHPKRMFYRQL